MAVARTIGVSVGAGVLVGPGVKVTVGARVGPAGVGVVVGARVGDLAGTEVAEACWMSCVGVAGVTGVEVEDGANVAVALGAALLHAVSSRTRKRNVSFFITQSYRRNYFLSTPALSAKFNLTF